MNNKFFTFIKPYLSYIDNGDLFRKPFSWLYLVIGVINLLLPFYILYKAIDSNLFDMQANVIIVVLLVWVIIAFVSWVSFQIWWDRKSKVCKTSSTKDDFIATPVFSHFLQTFGEWLGTWIAIVGFSVSLLSTIILGEQAALLINAITNLIGIPFFLETGLFGIILLPIYGFLTIVVTRFLAEQFRALSSIANNTRKS